MNSSNRKKPIDGIIIHSMLKYIRYEEQLLYAPDFLREIGLSAHFFIEPNGQIIHDVPLDRVAWHAGTSYWEGQKNLNDTFVGIELLIDSDGNEWNDFVKSIKQPDSFTNKHYKACGKLCEDLMRTYDIPIDRVLRHSEVSGPDVRDDYKIDPGEGFSMETLLQNINSIQAGTVI